MRAAPSPTLRQFLAAIAGAVLLVVGATWLGATIGWRLAALWVVGAGLGLALFHATFGFAGAFRALLAERRGAGIRAQMLLLALLVVAFQPAIAVGEVFGQPVRGFVFPAGIATLVGAFVFGIGMQLGGGCASGTLFAVGGGGARNLLTLICFVVGATFAAWDTERWAAWPALPPIALPSTLGLLPAMALALAVFAAVACGSARLERARHGAVAPISGDGHVWRGPWPLAWGAVALAALSVATLILAGRPWAITAAFPLWGSLLVDTLGWDDPVFWPFWEEPTRAEALLRPLATDRITVMDLGLVVGALLAAGLAGRFGFGARFGLRPALAAILGGLLLGWGAVVASGCNVSAYISGIASGSLHGWAWIGPGLLGNWVGLRLRPAFGLGDRVKSQ